MDLHAERYKLEQEKIACAQELNEIEAEKRLRTAHLDVRLKALHDEIDKLARKKEALTDDLRLRAQKVYQKRSDAERRFADLFHGLEPIERSKAEITDYLNRGLASLEKRPLSWSSGKFYYTTTRYSVATGGSGLVKIAIKELDGSWECTVRARHLGDLGVACSAKPEDAYKDALALASKELARREDVEQKRVIQDQKQGKHRYRSSRRYY